MRRTLGVIVIVAALLVSVLAVGQVRRDLVLVKFLRFTHSAFSGSGLLPQSPIFDSASEKSAAYPDDWTLTRAAVAKDFPADAAAMRALATATPHPPRGDLWNWWRLMITANHHRPAWYDISPFMRRSPASTTVSDPAPNPGAPVDTPEDATWDAAVDYLRAADPDNGWPLYLRAMRDLGRSVREYDVKIPDATQPNGEREATRYEVVPARAVFAARAAREVHEAVTAPRFDQALDDLARMEFDRLGGRADTLDQAIRNVHVYGGFLLPHLQLIRHETRTMMAEAERRAALAPDQIDDGLDAYQVLDDQLTLAARFMEGENTLVSMLVGVAMLHTVAEEGDRILRQAGRPQDAERLVARARLLARPMALNKAIFHLNERRNRTPSQRPLSFLYNDPALLAEAQAILDDTTATPPGPAETARRQDWGLLGGLLAPAVSRAVYAPELTPSRTAVRESARLEFYAFFRVLLTAATVLLALWLLWWLAAYGLNFWCFRREGAMAAASGWPGPWGIVAGAFLFAAPALLCGYGLILIPGSPLAQALDMDLWPTGRPGGWTWMWMWTVFWPLWGLLAGWYLLHGYADRATRRACPEPPSGDDPEDAPETNLFWRRGMRLAAGGLMVSALLMPAVTMFAGDRASSGLADGVRVVGFGLLGVAALAALLPWLEAWGRKPVTTRARARNQWILTGLAGGILLWAAFTGFVAERERAYAQRDTLLITDLDREPNAVFFPQEGRVVGRYRTHVRAVLQAEEGARDAAGDR